MRGLVCVLCLQIYLNHFRASEGCRRQRLLARRSRQFRGSYVLVFIWLLSTRSEICVVLDSACPNSGYRAKRERRRVIRHTWIPRGSLFYLRHVRSCAASTAGSNKSAGDSGPLSCSPSGLRTFVEYVRDWVQSAFTSSSFGVELAILWILLGNHQVEYWRLGFPVILRLCGVHIPISWCRLLTCVSVGSVVWESSSWLYVDCGWYIFGIIRVSRSMPTAPLDNSPSASCPTPSKRRWM